MRTPANLNEVNRRVYEKIFEPSATEPLEWREVRALFRDIGQVKWLPNGDFKVTRNGHELILRPAPTKDVSGPDELLEVQRFLKRSESMPHISVSPEAEREPLTVVRIPNQVS
jgi:hypothetical protein